MRIGHVTAIPGEKHIYSAYGCRCNMKRIGGFSWRQRMCFQQLPGEGDNVIVNYRHKRDAVDRLYTSPCGILSSFCRLGCGIDRNEYVAL